MLAGMYAKVIGVAALLLILLGLFLWGHHAGAASVQAKWDAAKVAQQIAVAKAQAHVDVEAETMRNSFNALSASYEAAVHAKHPAVADSVAAGVDAGTFQLRDDCQATARAGVSEATARSRAADAAATQAIADRVQAAIAAVRAGDEADRQNAQLRAQVIGLQDVLAAERGGR
jgi:hypothetical protein